MPSLDHFAVMVGVKLGVVRIHATHDAQQRQHGYNDGHGLKFLHFHSSTLSKNKR